MINRNILILFLLLLILILINNNIESFQDSETGETDETSVANNELPKQDFKIYGVNEGELIKPYTLFSSDIDTISKKINNNIKTNNEAQEKIIEKINYQDIVRYMDQKDITFNPNLTIKKNLETKNDITCKDITVNSQTGSEIMLGKDSQNNLGINLKGNQKYVDFTSPNTNYDGRIIYSNTDNKMSFINKGNFNSSINKNGNFYIKKNLGIDDEINDNKVKLLLRDNNPELKLNSQDSKSKISFHTYDHPTPASQIEVTNYGNDSGNIDFKTKLPHSAENDLRSRFTIKGNGNIGVNNTNPQTKLDIDGEIKAQELCIGNTCITPNELRRIINYEKTCVTPAFFYQHCNYGGYVIRLPPGDYRNKAEMIEGSYPKVSSNIKINNDLSSIKPNGLVIDLYSKENFQGARLRVVKDISCLVGMNLNCPSGINCSSDSHHQQGKWNDTISSMKIRQFIPIERGAPVYTGCGFTYSTLNDYNRQCKPWNNLRNPNITKWVDDRNKKTPLERGVKVYTGCGYTYSTVNDHDHQCKRFNGNINAVKTKWIDDRFIDNWGMDPLLNITLPKVWIWAKRKITVKELNLNNTGKNILKVNRGQNISLRTTIYYEHSGGGYCPGCIVQIYIVLLFNRQAHVNGSELCMGMFFYGNKKEVTESITFEAPTVPGTYYFCPAVTLQYRCQTYLDKNNYKEEYPYLGAIVVS